MGIQGAESPCSISPNIHFLLLSCTTRDQVETAKLFWRSEAAPAALLKFLRSSCLLLWPVIKRLVEQLRNDNPIDASADAATHLVAAEHLLLHCLHLAFRVSPVMVAGIQSFGLARRMLSDLASESECQTVLGGSPANPTVHMNLALWGLSQDLLAHAPSKKLLQSIPTERLVQQYRQGNLPPPLQDGLARFLEEYGHQGVCELDVGVARWSEDPTYVFNILISYVEMEEDVCKPDRQIQSSRDSAIQKFS